MARSPFLQRNIAVFFGRIESRLVLSIRRAWMSLRTGVGRIDDLVDVTQFGGLVGIGEFFAVFLRSAVCVRLRDRAALLISFRQMMLTAPSAPMTAISAVG